MKFQYFEFHSMSDREIWVPWGLNYIGFVLRMCPRGLRRVSAANRLLGLGVWFPPGKRTSVSYECCVYSGRVLCNGMIARPKESDRVWCDWVWSWSLDSEEDLHTSDCHVMMKTEDLPRILRFGVPNRLITCLYVLNNLRRGQKCRGVTSRCISHGYGFITANKFRHCNWNFLLLMRSVCCR